MMGRKGDDSPSLFSTPKYQQFRIQMTLREATSLASHIDDFDYSLLVASSPESRRLELLNLMIKMNRLLQSLEQLVSWNCELERMSLVMTTPFIAIGNLIFLNLQDSPEPELESLKKYIQKADVALYEQGDNPSYMFCRYLMNTAEPQRHSITFSEIGLLFRDLQSTPDPLHAIYYSHVGPGVRSYIEGGCLCFKRSQTYWERSFKRPVFSSVQYVLPLDIRKASAFKKPAQELPNIQITRTAKTTLNPTQTKAVSKSRVFGDLSKSQEKRREKGLDSEGEEDDERLDNIEYGAVKSRGTTKIEPYGRMERITKSIEMKIREKVLREENSTAFGFSSTLKLHELDKSQDQFKPKGFFTTFSKKSRIFIKESSNLTISQKEHKQPSAENKDLRDFLLPALTSSINNESNFTLKIPSLPKEKPDISPLKEIIRERVFLNQFGLQEIKVRSVRRPSRLARVRNPSLELASKKFRTKLLHEEEMEERMKLKSVMSRSIEKELLANRRDLKIRGFGLEATRLQMSLVIPKLALQK